VGLRGRSAAVQLVIDGALAGATVPWLLDAQVRGSQLLTETVGLTGGLGLRSGSQPVVDGDEVAGRAGGTELRLSAGVDLIF